MPDMIKLSKSTYTITEDQYAAFFPGGYLESFDDVVRGSDEKAWGSELCFLHAMNPQIVREPVQEEVTGLTLNYIYWDYTVMIPSDDQRRDVTQWPNGGWTAAEPVSGDFPQSTTTYWQERIAPPVNPVWVCSSLTWPWIYGETVGIQGAASESFVTGLKAVVHEASVWSFDPNTATNWTPHVVAGDYTNPTLQNREAITNKYWMGCAPYEPVGARSLVEYRFPNNLDGVYAPASGFSNNLMNPRFELVTWPWSTGGNVTSSSRRLPGPKIDGGYSGPGMEFTIPSALQSLIDTHGAANLTVISSTADVTMNDVRRIEYKWTHLGRQPSDTTPYTAGEKYGNKLEQYGIPSGGGAETLFKLYQYYVEPTSSGSNTSPNTETADNTHYDLERWTAIVEADIGGSVTYAGSNQAPPQVPKRPPYIASGDPNAPAVEGVDFDMPTTAKLGHYLVGIQDDTANQRSGAQGVTTARNSLLHYRLGPAVGKIGGGCVQYDDITAAVRTALEATYNATPAPYTANDLEGTGKLHQAIDDVDCLQDIRDNVAGEWDTGLVDEKYRALARSDASGTIDTDTETTVNMMEVAQALIDDNPARTVKYPRTAGGGGDFTMQHEKYRLYPCLPHDSVSQDMSEWDGEPTNITPFCNTFLPGGIAVTEASRIVTLDNICFQEFSSWQIKNWTMTVQLPDLSTQVITITTPWD